MSESRSLYLLKSVPRFLINMLFISKLHISHSQHLQKECQKNGGVGYIPAFGTGNWDFSINLVSCKKNRMIPGCWQIGNN